MDNGEIYNQNSCETPYTRIVLERSEKLNDIVRNVEFEKLRDTAYRIVLHGNRQTSLRRFIDLQEDTDAVGALLVYLYRDNELYLDNMEVFPEFKGKGLGTYMTALALDRFPNTQTIRAVFVGDNGNIFKRAVLDGLNDNEALRLMPLSRMCTRLGFSRQEIDRSSGNDELVAWKDTTTE